jgi:serine/threonine-protein kinase
MGGEYRRDQSSNADTPSQPSDTAIRDQLERIVKSKRFIESERLCRFLAWTVDQVLQGKREDIKQYSIGREVFDRRPEFDPRIDSIVRTEAQRLRRKLSEYYREDGASDPVLISFAPGSYAPVFSYRNGVVTTQMTSCRPELVPVPHRPAVAVLPFSNLSADPDQEYFCQGIAESIQGRLANSHNLKVISPFSAFRFVPGEPDLPRIRRDLHVDMVVQGSVRQLGTRARIHARAVDVATGTCTWAESFDREMDDLFVVEDEIATAAAKALTGQPEAEPCVADSVPPSNEAYKLYLRGRYLWNKLTVDSCEAASDCFLRTILIASNYAPAYAALADVYHWLIFFGVRNPARWACETRRLSLKALRLSRDCADGYIALGAATAIFQWQWDDAEVFFRRGLELRPNYVPGYVQRAFCRLQKGNLEGSKADVERALDLDPLSPRSHRVAGIYLVQVRDYQGAIAAFDRALELGPDTKNTRYCQGVALFHAGHFSDAIAAINDSLEPATAGANLGVLVAAYAAAGQRQKATETLRRLHELSRYTFVPATSFIFAYTALGKTSEALDWLERAANERSTSLTVLQSTPLLDNLRDEPRFRTVLKRMNLD